MDGGGVVNNAVQSQWAEPWLIESHYSSSLIQPYAAGEDGNWGSYIRSCQLIWVVALHMEI